ncbi:MAG: T9SS type A sorting domain-containing protein [Flavipsychrobacter sp.]
MKPSSLLKLSKLAAIITVLFSLSMTATAQTDFKIGNGTAVNSSTGTPSPIHDWYDGDKHQFLYLASEMQAAGMGPGIITAIKWDVKNTNGQGTVPGYTVSIGTTTASSLTGWSTAASTTIYGPANYTATTGMNVFTFPTPLVWNGTDNIVIQTCHGVTGRCGGYTRNCSVEYTTTSFNSGIYVQRDCSGSQCTQTSYSTTRRSNVIMSWAAPCTGVPSGFTIDGPYQVCPNRLFSLTLAGPILSNLSYQWQYSDMSAGTGWTNFTGASANAAVLSDAISAQRWYRCVIKCDNSGLTFTTPPKHVGISPFYFCYCVSYAKSAKGLDIGNVTVISAQSGDTLMNNGDPNPGLNNSKANNTYTEYNYLVQPFSIYRDSSYEFRIKEINSSSTFESGIVTAFIDFNRDGEYDTSKASGERIFTEAILGTNNPKELVIANMKVPSNAKIGLTGMRIILGKKEAKVPCDSVVDDGEVEDYIVRIDYRPCDGKMNAGTVLTSDTSICKNYDYVMTDTTYERARSGFYRHWQVSADNINWFTTPNDADKDTIQRFFTGQPLYYRLRTVCPPTDDTAYSTPTFVNAKAGYKCYCYSKAIGGKGVDTSDIGGITIGDFNTNTGGPHLLNPVANRPRTDYTDDKPKEFFTDSVYKFTVYHTLPVIQHGDAKITVFVDFNNNKEYDIPEERIFTGFTSVSGHTLVDQMKIPYNVITDVPTGMRFVLNNEVGPNVPSDEACGPYTSGETEDMIVIFRRRFPTTIGNVHGKLDGFGLYPNPTTGKFHVQFDTPNKVEEVKLRITNVTGQQLFEATYTHNGGTFNQALSLEGKPSGVYFVELQADGQKLMRKLIVD